jgi:hypothetical protein
MEFLKQLCRENWKVSFVKTKKEKGDIFCVREWGWESLRTKPDVSGVEPLVSVITQFPSQLVISVFQLKILLKQE